MYLIIVYDTEHDNCVKLHKLLKRYLFWNQNSVFEGEISEVRLKELLMESRRFMVMAEDSMIIFKGRSQTVLDKQIVGKERGEIDQFI